MHFIARILDKLNFQYSAVVVIGDKCKNVTQSNTGVLFKLP